MLSNFIRTPPQIIAWWRREMAGLVSGARRAREVRVALDGSLDLAGANAHACVIVLDSGAALIERRRLPATAWRRLGALSALIAARDWPAPGSTPRVAWRVDERESGWTDIVVSVVLTAPEIVKQAIEASRAANLRPCAVDIAGTDGRGALGVNLAPELSAKGRVRTRVAALLRIMLILAASALAWSEWSIAGQARDRAETALAAARAKAAPALTAGRELQVATDWLAALSQRVADGGRASARVEIIARTLPDQAFLTQMTMGEGVISLTGEAQSAGGVLAALDKDAGLGPVRFAAPVVRIAARGRDRFQIRIGGAPAPEQ